MVIFKASKQGKAVQTRGETLEGSQNGTRRFLREVSTPHKAGWI